MIAGMDGGAVASGSSRHKGRVRKKRQGPSYIWTPNAARDAEMREAQNRKGRLRAALKERQDRLQMVREARVREIFDGLKPYHEVALKRLRAVTYKRSDRTDTVCFIETCSELLAVKIPGEVALKLYRALMAGQRKIGKTTANFSLTRRVLLAQHHEWAKSMRKAEEKSETDYDPYRSM